MEFKTQFYGMIGLLIALLIGVILWLVGFFTKKDTIKTIGLCLAIIPVVILVIINFVT
jgi:hypothetical protein